MNIITIYLFLQFLREEIQMLIFRIMKFNLSVHQNKYLLIIKSNFYKYKQEIIFSKKKIMKLKNIFSYLKQLYKINRIV